MDRCRTKPRLKSVKAGPDSRPIAVLIGPTCSGKTGLAVSLAARMVEKGVSLEVIGADARQIYRGISVGTAKPTPGERASVHHHMLDVADPDEVFSAARFAREARGSVEGVYRRGGLPLVVGGSGLYIRALLEGLFEGPDAQPALRQELENAADRIGASALHQRLESIDPEAAVRIHPNDRKRIIRAIEVFEATGRPISALRREECESGFIRPLYIGIKWPPALLARRIEGRVREMIANGIGGEAARLEKGGFLGGPAFEGLGYPDALFHVRGELEAEALMDRLCQLHRGYAKRQRTWFRKIRGVCWLNAAEGGEDGLLAHAEKALIRYLEAFSAFTGGKGQEMRDAIS